MLFVVDSSNADDANFISDVEINTNVVNECGRTLQGGNIDIGEQTENALADGNVTQTTAGSRVKVFIKQVNEQGAGPFTCDMDPTGNSIGVTGQTPLTVRESEANGNGIITLRVAMPNDLQCTGGMNQSPLILIASLSSSLSSTRGDSKPDVLTSIHGQRVHGALPQC